MTWETKNEHGIWNLECQQSLGQVHCKQYHMNQRSIS